MDPVFLTLGKVIALHADQLRRNGGTFGLRDEGLLRSALAQAEATFGGRFLHEDLAAMASAYLFHISGNHPFVDGNKRVATACTLLFLALNHKRLVVGSGELAKITLAVASGAMTKDALAEWIRANVTDW